MPIEETNVVVYTHPPILNWPFDEGVNAVDYLKPSVMALVVISGLNDIG